VQVVYARPYFLRTFIDILPRSDVSIAAYRNDLTANASRFHSINLKHPTV